MNIIKVHKKSDGTYYVVSLSKDIAEPLGEVLTAQFNDLGKMQIYLEKALARADIKEFSIQFEKELTPQA